MWTLQVKLLTQYQDFNFNAAEDNILFGTYFVTQEVPFTMKHNFFFTTFSNFTTKS
jgi:hypothetical protein